MTREREEAITELNTFKIGAKSESGKNALDMAIKALKQEPCEDLINQRAATCRHGGHCEWVACDKCNHYEPNALSKQHCDDCISRQDVNNLVEELARVISDERCCILRGKRTIMQDILDLPSVIPKEKTGWIPVSERLPEESGDYLVTIKWLGSYSGDAYTEINIAEYRKKLKEWDCVDVIAWMPLPAPFESQESEETRNE